MLRQECKRVAAVSATPRSSPPSRRRSWRSRATALAATPLFRNSPLPFFTERARACAFVLSSTARYKRGQHAPIPRNESGEGVWS